MKNSRWLTGILLVSLAGWLAFDKLRPCGSTPGVVTLSNATSFTGGRIGTSPRQRPTISGSMAKFNNIPGLREASPFSHSSRKNSANRRGSQTAPPSEFSNRKIPRQPAGTSNPRSISQSNSREGPHYLARVAESESFPNPAGPDFAHRHSATVNDPSQTPRPFYPPVAPSFSTERSDSGTDPLKMPPDPEFPAAWVDLGEGSGLAPEESARIDEEAIALKAKIEGSDHPPRSPEYQDLWNQSIRDSDRWFRLRYGSRAWMRHHIAAHQMTNLYSQVEE